MPPIRKGDGTPVEPKGVSQIRTGDGRILFDGVAIPDIVVSRPSDDSSDSGTDVSRGLVVEAQSDFGGIGARISDNVSGVSRARLYDYNSGGYVATTDISGLSSGDAFGFEDVDIKDGQEYGIELDDDGGSFTQGYASEDNYPYDGDEFIITGASIQGSKDDGFEAINVNDIGNPDDVLS